MTIRVPCTNCGAEILQSTADKNGGLCMPCVQHRRHKSKRSSIRANPENWSEKNKGSREYGAAAIAYFDEFYWCMKCGAAAVYTAEEQREDLEIRKQSVYKSRTLCSACWRSLGALNADLAAISERWAKEKSMLKNDRKFLSDWLDKLELRGQYGRRKDTSTIQMLQRLLVLPNH